ncbi:MAG: hypothetical protein IT186_07895 [Acidobacteria bacterium]|nr:hypothetical protein [Acidobacteriota bacterium]
MARLGLYQPFIEDRNVRRLYQLKVRFREREGRRVPMTVLVNRILDDFFDAGLGIAVDETRSQLTRSEPGISTPVDDRWDAI